MEKVLYLETHEWVKLSGSKAKVGISVYAADVLGDIVFFDLPSVGERFKKGEVFGAVESVKSASDLYMPLTGTITNVNLELEDNPELVNEDALKNFILEIAIENEEELTLLLSEDDYQATL